MDVTDLQSLMPPQALEFLEQGTALALNWLTSPAAWVQFILLVAAFVAAWFARRIITPILVRLLTPAEASETYLSKLLRFALLFLPLLLPLLAYGFTAIGEQAARAALDAGDVIAFGKRFFLFLAARILVQQIVTDPFLKLLGKYLLIPVAVLYLFGLLDSVVAFLAGMTVSLGNISFSALALVRGVVAGSLLFWLGRWSNTHSGDYIRGQAEMRPATRELAAKSIEIAIFGGAFLLLMSIMGINLSALAVLGGAIGVGLGFGLQKIASNFISGVILLLEGQATVGDFVALDGGEPGKIVQMNARATILEMFDGRWIVVPNEDFIVGRVTNYSDSGSANRYEVDFSVSYDTDINRIPDIVEKAAAKHPYVLDSPEPPDCELRAFGDSGIEFSVEFWVNGIDDGKNKFRSDVMFLIWNALRDEKIEIPFPQRVVHLKQ
ncbi:MAG: mechanosensitive ion channel domain-containing protein [Pseudomonadota bacterium]